MRILIASVHLNLVGGVEKYLQAILPGLLERGHKVALLHEHPCDRSVERIDPAGAGIPVWCAGTSGSEESLRSVAAWQPDVAYFQGMESLLLEAALVEKYPTVFYAHNYYGTCVSGRKCHLVPQPRPCSRKMGAACLLQYYPRRCGGWHPGTLFRTYREQSERQSRLPDFHAILVASRHMYQEFQRHGVSSDQLHLVPLPSMGRDAGVDPPQPKLPGDRILMAGRLTDLKGGQFLVQALPHAAKRLGRSLTLVVAGEGPERARLQNLAHQLGVPSEFTGWIDQEQTLNLMRESALLAVPSVWPEPFGLVGVEAGLLGIPAVAYNVGGISDWLNPGESGELATGNPPTVEGLADALVRALESPEHYHRICMGAWRNANRFGLDRHLAQLEPILASRQPLPQTTAIPAQPAGMHS